LATQDLTAHSQHNLYIFNNIVANRRAIKFRQRVDAEGQSVSFPGSAWMAHKLHLSVQRNKNAIRQSQQQHPFSVASERSQGVLLLLLLLVTI
jgi:hypothetical protein